MVILQDYERENRRAVYFALKITFFIVIVVCLAIFVLVRATSLS